MHLIVGHRGQDGSLLQQQLLADGQTVYGVGRDGLEAPNGAVDLSVSITNSASLREAIKRLQPQRIYYLAALHHSSQSLPDGDNERLLHDSLAINTLALADVLEAVRLEAPSARLFFAATSQVFGEADASPQNEDTPFAPRSPYAVSKVAGIELCRYFRRAHGIFAACGYLYNHESPRRSPTFLSRKTAIAVAAIAEGRGEKLILGALDAVVDWGYAPEYAQAMRLILEMPEPHDFIVASGQASTVESFVAAAFAHVRLDWRAHVTIDPALIRRPSPTRPYIGDPRRLHAATGWRANTNMTELAAIMVDAELAKGRASLGV